MTDKENSFEKDINVPSKEQIICKYKFQNKEKFDGKPYCTCFCELCEDLPICVHNCQIFEDYKQLQKEKFENLNNRQIVEDAENLIYENSELYKNLKEKEQECEQIKEKYEALKLENQEGYEIVAELKQECEELKEENQQLRNNLSDSLMFRFTSQDKQINRYRKALEEIKEYIYNNTDFDVNDSIQSKTAGYDILQIIKDV